CGAAGAASAGEDVLGADEGVVVDERLVRQLFGGDPLVGLVPAHDAGVAHGDVLDVHQDLVCALLVPDLPPGVAGVGQDGAYRALGPGDPGAVPIAGGVVRRRGCDAVAGQSFGDEEQAVAGEELGEDAPPHGGGGVVGGP